MRIITRWSGLRSTILLGALTMFSSLAPAQSATPAGTDVSFRGLDLAPDGTIWVSGSRGTVLRSTDGGKTWDIRPIEDAKSLDLRDIEAIDATTAYTMVAGADTGRIYKTTDGGQSWSRQYDDTRKGIFLDGIAFWDASNGIAVGDPMDGKFVVLRTEDGGAHWTQLPAGQAPPSREHEGIFAASGSTIQTGPGGQVWVGTGANTEIKVGRLLVSKDYGRTWTATDTPVPSGTEPTGIFSLAFRDALHGIAVGGDYTAPNANRHNVAITADGGKTWKLGDTTGVTGYLSAVAYVPSVSPTTVVAVGTVGVFTSSDEGMTWRRLRAESYNAVAVGKAIVAVGADGRVSIWKSLDEAHDHQVTDLQREPVKSD